MSNASIMFLGGVLVTLVYGLVWRFRQKGDGVYYGYDTYYYLLAPIFTLIGVLFIVTAIMIRLFNQSQFP